MTKTIVLDANILIRGVLGSSIEPLLKKYANKTDFLTVEEAFEDAAKYVPAVVKKRGGNEDAVKTALEKLEAFRNFVQIVPVANIAHLEEVSRKRLAGQDEEDWPYLALALLLNSPVWTEDTDFFGVGVATWRSQKIEQFLESSES
jgi:predicted nucleic acid-binding protein